MLCFAYVLILKYNNYYTDDITNVLAFNIIHRAAHIFGDSNRVSVNIYNYFTKMGKIITHTNASFRRTILQV